MTYFFTSPELSVSEFLDQVAALIPLPRKHRHRYSGVLAPNSPWRALVRVIYRKFSNLSAI